MTFTVRDQPDSRYEAVCILQRFAGQDTAEEFEVFSDLHRDTEKHARALGLSASEEAELFGTMRTVYDEVLLEATPDDPWLIFYFSPLSADWESLGILVHYLRYVFPTPEELSAETIRACIARVVTEEGAKAPTGQQAVMRACLGSSLGDAAKLRLIDFYLDPMAHMERCGAIIEAYAARLRQRQRQDLLLPLCARFTEELRHDNNACLLKLKLDMDGFEVVPSVYNYSAISIHMLPDGMSMGPCFVSYGILVDFFSRWIENEGRGSERLLRALKALDDKTRLRILTALHDGPMYGHEIAKLTGLSAATVSHHVSELFSKDLITIEKQGTSARYSLRGDTIEWVIGELRRLT